MRLVLLTVALAAIGSVRPAHADPVSPSRVITAPTAWLPPAGVVVGTGTLDHRFDGSAVVGIGIGGIAALDAGTDSDIRTCELCDGDAAPLLLGRASFRLGMPQRGALPALVFGVRTTFASLPRDGFGRVRVTEGWLGASEKLGPVRLHAGAMLVDAGQGDDLTLTVRTPTVRPFGAIEWTPAKYPKTTVMTDIAYVPRIEPAAIELEWVFGWGVRYQALSWGAIDLAVRHREDEGLGDSTVMVRVNGVLDLRKVTGSR